MLNVILSDNTLIFVLKFFFFLEIPYVTKDRTEPYTADEIRDARRNIKAREKKAFEFR